MSRLFKSPLGRQMHDIREKRRVDPRTGRPYAQKTEAEKLAEHEKLGVCHQQEGGPCQLHVTIPPGDKRCRMSKTMQVSCPYLSKPVKLRAKVAEETEENKKDEVVYEAPPEINL